MKNYEFDTQFHEYQTRICLDPSVALTGSKPCGPIQLGFNLDIQGPYQIFLAVINPLPISLLFIGLALYIKRTKLFYSLAFGIYLLLFIWLISNSIYYREFTDFVTVNTMLASSKVSAGLELLLLGIVPPLGWGIYILDFPILAFFFFKKWIRMDNRPFTKQS